MKINRKIGLGLCILFLALGSFLLLTACVTAPNIYTEKTEQVSDHFNGVRYFNPGVPQTLTPLRPADKTWPHMVGLELDFAY